jgi:hypothetical protein
MEKRLVIKNPENKKYFTGSYDLPQFLLGYKTLCESGLAIWKI